LVGGDVVDGVGRVGVRVYDDVADELAVEECFYAEIDVGLGAGWLPCILRIGVYDCLYRWPKGSPRESGANE
jgi:hypothetical protein